jgi:hypothetical protein
MLENVRQIKEKQKIQRNFTFEIPSTGNRRPTKERNRNVSQRFIYIKHKRISKFTFEILSRWS